METRCASRGRTIDDVVFITPKKLGDPGGYFIETFRPDIFKTEVGPFSLVQDNHSMSKHAGTVRGSHFQLEPKAQGKRVACSSGAFLDVAVDSRIGSPTYSRFIAEMLSAENARSRERSRFLSFIDLSTTSSTAASSPLYRICPCRTAGRLWRRQTGGRRAKHRCGNRKTYDPAHRLDLKRFQPEFSVHDAQARSGKARGEYS